jgi:HD-GYP domain-containing protein (c-di-GMP phosphodiesterase class II)
MPGSDEGRWGEDRARAREFLASLRIAARFRDVETAEHVERVGRTCALIGEQLGLGATCCRRLGVASALHDIGKIMVPNALLRKPGPLDAQERAMVERHAEIGHNILTRSSDPTMQLAATIALTHHERVDGQGYPRGLRGEQIPMPGRIAAVADVFDALTHDRVYRAALSVPQALSILEEGCGAHFDPRVLDAFAIVLSQVLDVRERHPDRLGPRAPRPHVI